MGTLLDILNDLLQERGKKTQELKGGLFLQYKAPETVMADSAIFCYRIEKAPSDTETKTVCKYLQMLLPQGTELRTDRKQTQYKASDGKMRIGTAVRWSAYQATQSKLLDGPTPSLLTYTEAK